MILQTEDQAALLTQPGAITIAIATLTHPEVIHHQAQIAHITVAEAVEARDRLTAVAVEEDHTAVVEEEEGNIFFLQCI